MKRLPLVFAICAALFFSVLPLVNTVKAQETKDWQCIGKSLADYMNGVIDGVEKENLDHIKLLSPAFNFTHPQIQDLLNAMGVAHARFFALDGIAGNAYNSEKPVTQWVNEAMNNPYISSKAVMVTETGNVSGRGYTITDLANEMRKVRSNDRQTYIGALLFNALGTNKTTGGYAVQVDSFSPADRDIICGGNCGKIGVNAATPFSQDTNYYDEVDRLGMNYELEIAFNDVGSTMQGITAALDRGITPVIRIGIGNDSGGFDSPKDYVAFLAQINSQIAGRAGAVVYAIAGPNEPDAELWASKSCETVETQAEYTPEKVACNTTTNEEFHSLRPYPVSACLEEIEDTALFCGNDLVAKNTLEGFPIPVDQGGKCELVDENLSTKEYVDSFIPGSYVLCTFEQQDINVGVKIDLSNSDLPIVGNTELVPNEFSSQDDLSRAQAANDYVSWYLNGSRFFRAEEPYPDISDFDKILSFAGPLRKLLPWRIQIEEQTNQIQQATASTQADAGIRHDQKAVCHIEGYPYPCMAGELVNKVIDTAGTILSYSPAGLAGNLSAQLFSNLVDDLTSLRLSEWQSENKLPPHEEDYPTSAQYWAAYKSWRGKFCIVVTVPSSLGGINIPPPLAGSEIPICVDDPGDLLKADYWANLFPYVPFSSTEDRVGEAFTIGDDSEEPNTGYLDSIQIPEGQKGQDVQISGVTFEETDNGDFQLNDRLYFAHMEEDSQLAETLQKTYISGFKQEKEGTRGYSGYTGIQDVGELLGDLQQKGIESCEIVDTRTNPGDDLYGEYDETTNTTDNKDTIKGNLQFDATYQCEFSVPTQKFTDCVEAGGDETACTWDALSEAPPCRQNSLVVMSIFTKTPKVEEVWERLVNGEQSIFKRIFPKPGPGTPVEEIEDIPAVTSANYTTTADQTLAGDPLTGRPGAAAQLYFPHLGSVQEYFLQGIQKALRPKDVAVASGPQASPTPTQQCTKLDDKDVIDYRNTGAQVKPLAQLIADMKKINPGQFSDNGLAGMEDNLKKIVLGIPPKTRYQYVIDKAIAAGYNPAYVLAIWIEETGAGHYSNEEFGCGGSSVSGFQDELKCFLGLFPGYSAGGAYDSVVGACRTDTTPTYEEFSLFYSVGICDTIQAQDYSFCGYWPGRIKSFYDVVAL